MGELLPSISKQGQVEQNGRKVAKDKTKSDGLCKPLFVFKLKGHGGW